MGNCKYCWFEFSYVEAGLILVLLVAIPFLIALIIIYIIYAGSGWSSSISCYEVCFKGSNANDSLVNRRNFGRKSSRFNNYLENIVDVNRKRRSISFPYVGALVEPLYLDGDDEILKCIVAVLTKNLVLTTKTCLNSKFKKKTKLRFFSNYWSQGGIIRRIAKVLTSNEEGNPQLVVLQLEEKILAEPVKLPNDETLSNKTGLAILTWSSNLGTPLQNRFKYKNLKREEVELLPNCPQIFGNVTNGLICRKEERANCENLNVHSPLFYENNLVAIHLGTYCIEKNHQTISYYQTIYQHLDWLKKITANGG